MHLRRNDEELRGRKLSRIWQMNAPQGAETVGGSFWMMMD